MNELNYKEMVGNAISNAIELELENVNWKKFEHKYQDEKSAKEIFDLVNGELFDYIESNFQHLQYWGNSCLDLAVATFCFLKFKGYDAEIIYGNVNINGSQQDEFDVTKEYLFHEYKNKVNEGEQDIHAWVGLGGNIIIDFSLMDRLIKLYKYPSNLGSVICGPAEFYEEKLKLIYKPILIGTDFFKVTNSYDPLDVLNKIIASN
ncbi:hypothetical protein [Acinetobacter sp. ANC 5502]